MKPADVVTIDDDVRQFVRWASAALGVSVDEAGRSAADHPTPHNQTLLDQSPLRTPAAGPASTNAAPVVPAPPSSGSHDAALLMRIPDRQQALFQGIQVARLVFAGATNSASDAAVPADNESELPSGLDVMPLAVDDRFLTWLIEQLRDGDQVPYAVPTLPDIRVHELSARLFRAYTVDHGTLHLSGCTLEERPLLRQTWLAAAAPGQPRLVHRFTDPQGVTLTQEEVEALGLKSLKLPTASRPRLGPEDVHAWCQAATKDLPASENALPEGAAVAASVVWCQFAAGKIEFVINEVAAEVSFSGWARGFVAGVIDPPAFECPLTGIQSHAIAATDDGRVTAREAIRACAKAAAAS